MYKKLGYSVYRRVLDYYSGDPDEDAYGIVLFFKSFVDIVQISVTLKYY